MPIQSETELYGPVKAFFEKMGYAVKGEIRHCDLVAVRDGEEPVLVELKRTFNLPLLIQGIDRQRQSGRVYLAVEQNRNGRAPHGLGWSDLTRLCRLLGLGLIVVRFYVRKSPAVEVLCDPEPYAPRKRTKSAERLMQEFRERSGDFNTGGSSKRKLVTVYREKALLCAHYLQQSGGPLATRRLRQLAGVANAARLMRDNHYGWFRHVSLGVYELTPGGHKGLEEYASILPQILALRESTAAQAQPEPAESGTAVASADRTPSRKKTRKRK